MLGRNLIALGLLVFLEQSVGTAVGIAQPAERLFRIKAGTYAIIGGLWGELTETLPNPEQAFVRLGLDSTNGTGWMTILDAARERAFSTLTNGVLSGTGIRFRYETDGPWPQESVRCQVEYTVTYDPRTLAFAGSRSASQPICCDIPYAFAHSNVVAEACSFLSAVPVSPRRGLLTLAWDNEPGVRLQKATNLPAPQWVDVPDSAGTNTVTLPMSASAELFRLAKP